MLVERVDYGERHRKFILLCVIMILVFVLLSFVSHAETQNDTQSVNESLSLSQNVTQKIFLYLAPNERINNYTLFSNDNPFPENMTVVYFYIEFFVLDENLNPVEGVDVSVRIIENSIIKEFYIDDGSNRKFEDNSVPDYSFVGNGKTNDDGRFFLIVPNVGRYNVTAQYGDVGGRSSVMMPYLYVDYPELWNGVYVSAIQGYSNSWLSNHSYLTGTDAGDGLSTNLVDSGIRFLMGFLLFVGVLAVPFFVCVLGFWVFKKYVS